MEDKKKQNKTVEKKQPQFIEVNNIEELINSFESKVEEPIIEQVIVEKPIIEQVIIPAKGEKMEQKIEPAFHSYEAIVKARLLNIRKSGSLNAEKAGILKENDKCVIIAEEGEWGQLDSGDWVKLEFLRRL